jgi:hypothetical protein
MHNIMNQVHKKVIRSIAKGKYPDHDARSLDTDSLITEEDLRDDEQDYQSKNLFLRGTTFNSKKFSSKINSSMSALDEQYEKILGGSRLKNRYSNQKITTADESLERNSSRKRESEATTSGVPSHLVTAKLSHKFSVH